MLPPTKPNPSSPPLQWLSEQQLQAIHRASLQILQRSGFHTPVRAARELLAGAGARVDGQRVYIPDTLVDRALATLQPVTLFDRAGRPALPLSSGRCTFGTIADTIFVLDPYRRTSRPFVKADQLWLTRLLDALPNIDWIQCVGQSKDVPDGLQTQVAVSQSLRATSKPIIAYPYDRQGLLDILDLAYLVAGGRDAFRHSPFLACVSVPAAPLAGTDYNLELLLTCADEEVPLLNYCCPAMGGNSPASTAATLAMAYADWLAHIVIHQLRRPGAPVCTAGCTFQLMDMKTTLWSYCAPEALSAYTAVTQMAHRYGMPAWGIEMTCDTAYLDAQAGAEMMAQCQTAMLAGVDMVHNAGIFGAGKLCAAESVLLADEIIAYCRALTTPPSVTSEELAAGVEMIGDVGPLGEYVSHPHTLQHFRDFWYPSVFQRAMTDGQRQPAGGFLLDELNTRARHLIETHVPEPLPSDTLAELDRLEAGWYARYR